jgi:hypothetical protein
MFRSAIEDSAKAWFYYEPFTLPHYYQLLQKEIVKKYIPLQHIVENYSKKVNRKIYPITEEYLKENPEILKQNVALLKNAMELWREATHTTDAVAPILYHYSWHCFNSFFVYTFFHWEPMHSNSHGVNIINWCENIEKIQIQFLKQEDTNTKGIFQRLIDTWTLLGASTAFSSFLPVFEGEEIEFISNNYNLLKNSNSLKLKDLNDFNSINYEKSLVSDLGKRLIFCPFLANSTYLPTDILRSYLIIFSSSSLARYRPVFWDSILLGERSELAQFALQYRDALLEYTLGKKMQTLDFLNQVERIFRSVIEGNFSLKKKP